ncbi:uncharacterized protein [Aristolochia californica]|uniref:uncharacterized protein n=1 Tax=Aristolochia californica TaxID=171875 RepID=UPI0035DF97A1
MGVFGSGLRTSLTRSTFDESSNPYYLHHSDSPEQVLVSQLLTGENYTSWSRAMTLALSVKNKVGFIDGSIPEPQSADPPLLNSWTRNNHIVISWILNSVSKEISASVMFAASAREIWLALRDRYQQRNGPRIFQLKRELMNLRQDKDSVSTYFTKLTTLWEELNNYRPHCSCGKCCGGIKDLIDYHNMEYVMSFLMGLDDSFSHVRGQLLLMDLMPPLNRVFSLVVQEEQQRRTPYASSSHTPTDTMAFAFKFGQIDVLKPGPQTSQKSHSTYSAPRNPNPNTSRNQNYHAPRNPNIDKYYCTHCKTVGHTIARCFKIHGYPTGPASKPTQHSHAVAHQVSIVADSPGSPSIGSLMQNLNSAQFQQLVSMLSTHLSSFAQVTTAPESSTSNCVAGICFSVSLNPLISSPQSWITDSGATRHICSHAPVFVSLYVIPHTTVTLPNNTQLLVHLAGNIKLHHHLVLKNDLSTQRTIGKGDKVQDLYVLSVQTFVSTLAAHRTKFHPHARVCVFLGYPAGVKRYKFYDVETKHVFISRDATFYEEVFPFHTITNSNTVLDPFPDLVLPHSFIQPHSLPELDSSPIYDSPASYDAPVDDIPTHNLPLLVPSTSTGTSLRKSTRTIHPPHYL